MPDQTRRQGARPEYPAAAGNHEAQKHGIEIPEIGRWYRSPHGNLFEVVAVDEQDGTIELQHFDGTLEESEPDSWLEMHVERAEAPEDWSGSVDIDPEDLPGRRAPQPRDWQTHIDQLEEFD